MEKSPEKRIAAELPGAFGNKIIKLEALTVPDSKKLLINVHGSYGSLHGGGDKYLTFAESLQNNEVCQTVLYASSRKDITTKQEAADYQTKQALFEGKSFEDELSDLREVLNYCLQNAEQLFNVKSEELEITLNGNSLGGILALVIANEFPQVKNISTVGTGLRLDAKDAPILRTLPPAQELSQMIGKYSGRTLMQFGTEDTVFSKQSFEELFKSLPGNERSFFVLEGVNHQFNQLNGQTSVQPYQQIFRNIQDLLVNGILVGGGVQLPSETQARQEDETYQKFSTALHRQIDDLGLQGKFTDTSPYDDTAVDNH